VLSRRMARIVAMVSKRSAVTGEVMRQKFTEVLLALCQRVPRYPPGMGRGPPPAHAARPAPGAGR
jgi:hypothetical protein